MERYYSLHNILAWDKAFDCSLYSLGRGERERVLDYFEGKGEYEVEESEEMKKFLSELEKILEENLI